MSNTHVKKRQTHKIFPTNAATTVRTRMNSQRKMTAVDSIIATTRSAVESSSRLNNVVAVAIVPTKRKKVSRGNRHKTESADLGT